MHSRLNIFRLLPVVAALVLFPKNVSAQYSVRASIDSSVMLIGQQSLFHLELSGPSNTHFRIPTFSGDTLVKGLEILRKNPIDTTFTKDGRIELKFDLIVTSFDSGLYYVPPIPVVIGSDTVYSNDTGIKVVTLNVDTVKKTVFDIKGIQSPPFVLKDYLLQILLFFLIYALALLFIWLYLRKKYKQAEAEQRAYEDTLPPHVQAIIELDRLRSDKIWKQGRKKEFYTKLSEIIRKYLERRFQINALEMTSEEILEMFRKDKITQSVYQNLSQILQLSDLVKFAKIEPMESDNELSIMNSYLFINQTKLEEIKSIEEQKEEALLKESENEPDKNDATSDDLSKYMPK
jgi:hypothetical protein